MHHPDHPNDPSTAFTGPIHITVIITPLHVLQTDNPHISFIFNDSTTWLRFSKKRVGSPNISTLREGPISPNNEHSHKISCPDSEQDRCSTSVVDKPVTGCFEHRHPTVPKKVTKFPENERPSIEPPQSASAQDIIFLGPFPKTIPVSAVVRLKK
ncbi:hypothetical protein PGTUg99_029175 [Puccinia graminis f. sp. tritici]|uniref:Uncharacterized protein n=1 Tax=Puccinia graminis f. sp. tritici TaxID=56615 RepID=A0A5B0SCQ3_PUCGR|nr:hypothetical protein PGTUg99_029175 [Puccinia graminis f. sp. tritici]